MNTRYEYNAPKAKDNGRVFVSVSGSMTGYSGWGSSESQAHEIEMCVRCAHYLENAMKYLKGQVSSDQREEFNEFPPVNTA